MLTTTGSGDQGISAKEWIARDSALGALVKEVRDRLDSDPGHDLGHLMRVATWTLRFGRAGQPGGVDAREAVAAALLHDIVNVPKDSPLRSRASELCAEEARRLLGSGPGRYGFDSAAIERIGLAILNHSFSRGAVPQDPLGQALQDADRIEAVGAIGIMRVFSTGVKMGATYFHPEDPWAESRPLDDRAYSIDHFYTKLLKLAGTMCTPGGRAEGEKRTEILRAFLAALRGELTP